MRKMIRSDEPRINVIRTSNKNTGMGLIFGYYGLSLLHTSLLIGRIGHLATASNEIGNSEYNGVNLVLLGKRGKPGNSHKKGVHVAVLQKRKP
ncbi:hypothetical protein TNIN_266301 [Trichonephila inaurata madagascariensis]|uniref:Uncharacterized protein n=1 Tax=Trichonephila inaurata madagascariensis TaxID=2747483 RepID=A0A8X6I617_9ARAC|nr:hypothetical protein TNIN_266301 [Trichonephila inaurata madagascariensis]